MRMSETQQAHRRVSRGPLRGSSRREGPQHLTFLFPMKAAPGQAPPVASFSGHPGRRRALLGPHWSWCWGRRVWVSPGRAACGLLVQWPEAAHLAQRNRGTDWGRHGLHPLRPPHGPCPAGLHSGVTLDGRQRVPGACGPCSAVGVLGCGPAPAPVMWLGASRFRSLGGRGL